MTEKARERAIHLAKWKISITWALGKIGRTFLNSRPSPKKTERRQETTLARRASSMLRFLPKKSAATINSLMTESLPWRMEAERNFFSELKIPRAKPWRT